MEIFTKNTTKAIFEDRLHRAPRALPITPPIFSARSGIPNAIDVHEATQNTPCLLCGDIDLGTFNYLGLETGPHRISQRRKQETKDSNNSNWVQVSSEE